MEAVQPGRSSIERIYAVCPACSARVHVAANQPMASCHQCGNHAEVAWWETG